MKALAAASRRHGLLIASEPFLILDELTVPWLNGLWQFREGEVV